MDTPYGKPARSVRRFSFLKWGVSGVLLALLLLTWLAGNQATDEVPVRVAGGRISSADGGSPTPASLALELGSDGAVKVQGVVTDAATRDQWLNQVRIGARGARVMDELRIDTASPAAASGWGAHLSPLVALMRERRLEGLRVEGNSVLLKGAALTAAEKDETDRTILAQLPPGYRVDSRITIGAPATAASRPAASASSASSASSAPPASSASTAPSSSSVKPLAPRQDSRASGPQDRAATPRNAGDQQVGDQKAGDSRAGGQKAGDLKAGDKAGERKAGDPKAGERAVNDRGGADKLAQTGRSNAEPAGKEANSKPTGCPPQLRSLAQPVYFPTDGAGISAADRARLERLGECLGRSQVRIVGHSDPRLSDAYNQELSERRARAVADALRAGGLPSSRISVQGAGRGKPSTTASPEALQRSRRVDIQIR